MRVYLDTCVWCRLFDILDHKEIIEEFKAVVKIIQKAIEGKIEIISSSAVFVEISLLDPIRREKVEMLIDRIATLELKPSENTKTLAKKIGEDCGLDHMDSVHLALAIENNIDIFLSTDKDLYLYKRNCISNYGIVVKNPIEYEAEL